ncbi:SURF1 family protein [Moritella marina ATCC 15381]|uniref:SURF1-like protein n=1 Tax=Moritella marina ATCC 15381 TaxID=1202962 RepID=A0A5J6WH81_MORMI|nr:SURF1 family protein [Moritella marina]QFI36588.1 SURF1 family protein [Moritella marina ATCC 15381]
MKTHVNAIPKAKSKRKYKHPKRLIGFVAFSLVAIGICINLGLWQLARAQDKQALLDIKQIIITTLSQVTADTLHNPVSLQGYFDNKQPILLDNQTNNKRIGYHLYLPFHSDAQTILVNLGWLAASPSRQILPVIPKFTGLYHLNGTLSAPQGSPWLLGDNISTDKDNVLVVQRTAISQLQSYLGTPLKPLLLQLEPSSPVGFSKTWQITVMPPAKHTAYAVQWFALAFALSLCSGYWIKKY